MDQARRSEAALLQAQRKLGELELEAEASKAFKSPQTGTTQETGSRWQFAWSIVIEAFAAPHELLQPPKSDPPAIERLTVSVTETSKAPPVQVSLTTLVPRAWIPETWR